MAHPVRIGRPAFPCPPRNFKQQAYRWQVLESRHRVQPLRNSWSGLEERANPSQRAGKRPWCQRSTRIITRRRVSQVRAFVLRECHNRNRHGRLRLSLCYGNPLMLWAKLLDEPRGARVKDPRRLLRPAIGVRPLIGWTRPHLLPLEKMGNECFVRKSVPQFICSECHEAHLWPPPMTARCGCRVFFFCSENCWRTWLIPSNLKVSGSLEPREQISAPVPSLEDGPLQIRETRELPLPHA